MSNRGRSQNCKNAHFLQFVLHSSKNRTSPKELGWNHFNMKQVQFSQKSLEHETLFNTVVYGSNEIYTIMHNLKT